MGIGEYRIGIHYAFFVTLSVYLHQKCRRAIIFFMNAMKVLVTGASGLVGSSIVRELLKKSFEVYATGRTNSNIDKFGEIKKFFKVDITEYQNLATVGKLKNINVVIHSAGLAHQFENRTEKEFWKVNVLGTENVARLAVNLRVKHFILISSVQSMEQKPQI